MFKILLPAAKPRPNRGQTAAKPRPNRGQKLSFEDIRVRPTGTNAHPADIYDRASDTSHAISCAHSQYLIGTSTAELVYPQGLS